MPTSLETRSRILDAAVEEVRQHGHSDFRMGHVAEQAGVTTPHLYRHFDSRESVIGAAIDAWAAPMLAGQLVRVDKILERTSSPETFWTELIDIATVRSPKDDDELRWALGEALVFSWYHPEVQLETIALYRRLTLTSIGRLQEILGTAGGTATLSGRQISYFASGVWFGSLIDTLIPDDTRGMQLARRLDRELLDLASKGPQRAASPDIAPLVMAPVPADALQPSADGSSTKERILRAAIEELAVHSAVGFSLKGVASRAEVGDSVIYRHFRSRSELVARAGAKVVEEAYRDRLAGAGGLAAEVSDVNSLIAFGLCIGVDPGDDAINAVRRAAVAAIMAGRGNDDVLAGMGETARIYITAGGSILSSFADGGLITDRFDPEGIADVFLRYTWGKTLPDSDPATALTREEQLELVAVLFRDLLAP